MNGSCHTDVGEGVHVLFVSGCSCARTLVRFDVCVYVRLSACRYIHTICMLFCCGSFVTLQHAATHCNTLQHTATRRDIHIICPLFCCGSCATLQHTATHHNTLQHAETYTLYTRYFVVSPVPLHMARSTGLRHI